MGVTCETMSLQLLTAQAKLVEALAGMYMKSTTFEADEGLGELSLPGAPQVGLGLPWGLCVLVVLCRAGGEAAAF